MTARELLLGQLLYECVHRNLFGPNIVYPAWEHVPHRDRMRYAQAAKEYEAGKGRLIVPDE